MKKLEEELGVDHNHILSYRFDSFEYDGMTPKEIYEDIKAHFKDEKKYYLFLDEVQEIDNWEKMVNSINSDYNTDIYITGSNLRMMSSEISTYLTGRYVSFKIFTLSFREYLDFARKYTDVSDTRKAFMEYVKLGGFPGTHLHPYHEDEIYTIVKDIYNSVIYADIVKRGQIRKIDQVERIIKYTFSNIGNTFSAAGIAKYLKSERRSIDNETVYSYLQKLEKAYILHRCNRYDIKGKEILKTQEKFYLADTALRYCVLGYNPDTVAASLENIVYLELCRRGYEVRIGKYDSGEIDFIAERRGEKVYVQVTQQLSSEETIHREYDKLLEIKDNYPKYVLSVDDFAGGEYEGIRTMHIVDFLLAEN